MNRGKVESVSGSGEMAAPINGASEPLASYVCGVLKKSAQVNLVADTSFDKAWVAHVEDSLSALPEVLAAPSGLVVDIGSGGGFPGVPLAVASDRDVLLVDSREKKVAAVMDVVKSTGIAHIDGYAGRAEELAVERPAAFSLAVSRAVTSLPSLLELASPLLEQGGWLVAYKGNLANADSDEFVRAQLLRSTLGMSLRSWRTATVGPDAWVREIIVFEKTANPAVVLPRRPGMAQKRPYA